MAPGSLSVACSMSRKQRWPMGSAEKHSWPGGGQDLFPCIGSMIKGQQCFRRLTSMHLGRMLTNLQKHANHTQGGQYAIKSFADGAYGGACSVMMPSRSTRTDRARSEVKIFPRS